MNTTLTDKTVMITGATSGIGRATAITLAKNGCGKMLLIGRREERLRALQEEVAALGTQAHYIVLDVRNRELVASTFATLPQGYEKIDVLLNNAGLASGLDRFDEASIDDFEVMIDTNIKGLLYVSKAITPHMIKAQQGHIINIASIAGKEVYAAGNVYCATKHAVDALTRAMRLDLVQHGIKVAQMAPGAVNTEFSTVRFHGDSDKASHVYDGYTPLTGEDIAEALLFMITAPTHVNIADMLILPVAQGDSRTFIRK